MSDVVSALSSDPLFSFYAVKLGANHSHHFDDEQKEIEHDEPYFIACVIMNHVMYYSYILYIFLFVCLCQRERLYCNCLQFTAGRTCLPFADELQG